jgi:tripartite-type tricarboxylate transporter receptor subunit TctC
LPAKAPAAIVQKLNKAMSDALDDPAIHARLEELGLDIATPERRAPDYLAKFQADEVARWGKVVRDAGISAD